MQIRLSSLIPFLFLAGLLFRTGFLHAQQTPHWNKVESFSQEGIEVKVDADGVHDVSNAKGQHLQYHKDLSTPLNSNIYMIMYEYDAKGMLRQVSFFDAKGNPQNTDTDRIYAISFVIRDNWALKSRFSMLEEREDGFDLQDASAGIVSVVFLDDKAYVLGEKFISTRRYWDWQHRQLPLNP